MIIVTSSFVFKYFPSSLNAKLLFLNASGLKNVFEKRAVRFRDGVVWTVVFKSYIFQCGVHKGLENI